jgi:hypothetical protein
MKPRPVTFAERGVQIVALWQGRPPDNRRRADIAAFFQWLSDYAPWLVPPSQQTLEGLMTILEPYVVDE